MKRISERSQTIEIINKYHLSAAKKYGQNFLADPHIIDQIVNMADVKSDTIVIEIGPGIGALTEGLAMHAKQVICYEIDERLRPVLDDTLAAFNNVEIIFEDFMKADLDGLVNSLEAKDICIVTNLPYYITSDIIEKAVRSQSSVSRMVAMVQKEVALKLTGDHQFPLRMMIDYVGDIQYLMNVPKKVFIPAPHVDSAVLRINKKRTIDDQLCRLIKGGFKQKRKTILNNMKPFFTRPKDVLQECGIDPQSRAEELSIDDFIALYRKKEEYED